MKTCSECHKDKLLADFYIRKERRSGYTSSCKSCLVRRLRRGREKRKIEILNAYGGPICKCCRENELLFLSIDHIENDGAEDRRAIFGNDGRSGDMYAYLKRHNFPNKEKYQVLCMNCQIGKKLNGGACPHKIRQSMIAEYSRIVVNPPKYT